MDRVPSWRMDAPVGLADHLILSICTCTCRCVPVNCSSLGLVDPVLKGKVEARGLYGGRLLNGIEGNTTWSRISWWSCHRRGVLRERERERVV